MTENKGKKRSRNSVEEGSKEPMRLTKCTAKKTSLSTGKEGSQNPMPLTKCSAQKRSLNTEEEGSHKLKRTKESKGKGMKTEEWFFPREICLTRKLLELERDRVGKNEKLVSKLLRRICGEELIFDRKKQFLSSSEIALQHYNKEKNTDFELVKLVGGFQMVYRGIWHHVNFEAKTKDSDSPKLFFAELVTYDGMVTQCCILEPGATIGCGFCDPKGTVRHPANGFQWGCCPYEPPYIRSDDSPFTREQYRLLLNLKC